MTPTLLALLLALSSAQVSSDPLKEAPAAFYDEAGVEFRKGNFREALAKIAEARRQGGLSEGQRYMLALQEALSFIYLNQAKDAQPAITEALLSTPDLSLDPLKYGQEAKREFDRVRELPEVQPRLEKRREELRLQKLREEETRRQAEEAERRRRELAAIPALVPMVEEHNVLLNFLPFGVPQLDQGRLVPGVLFAVGQGVAITATILTYTQVQSYIDNSDGKVDPTNVDAARGFRVGNWIAFGLAIAVYAGGVLDAFLNHQDRTVSLVPREEYLRLRPPDAAPAPGAPDAPKPAAPAPAAKPSATFFLAPVPGGAAAGIVGRF